MAGKVKKVQGAKRDQARKSGMLPSQQPRRKLGRYVLLVALMLPVFIYLKPVQHLRGIDVPMPTLKFDDEVKITNVLIEGEFQFSSREALQADISALLAKDFVRLDLNEMREQLEALPWYKKVRLARQWPSTLKVNIEEEQPIARWGERGFINRYGELVLTDQLHALDDMPVLSGRDENAYDTARNYLLMSQLLNEAGLYISELAVDEQGAQEITFSSGFTLVLGKHQLSERLEKFLFLYKQQLKTRQQQLATIDMRYESGVAVQWLDTAQSEIASR